MKNFPLKKKKIVDKCVSIDENFYFSIWNIFWKLFEHCTIKHFLTTIRAVFEIISKSIVGQHQYVRNYNYISQKQSCSPDISYNTQVITLHNIYKMVFFFITIIYNSGKYKCIILFSERFFAHSIQPYQLLVVKRRRTISIMNSQSIELYRNLYAMLIFRIRRICAGQ